MTRLRRDPGAALAAQAEVVVGWLRNLSADELARPSVLTGWDVRVLAEHVAAEVGAAIPDHAAGIRSRLIEVVVHADDLSRSLPERPPIELSRAALGEAIRALVETLAVRHPGRSVEVRVPPYAAVQCGLGDPGPTHTRGTPPNVVECAPLVFLRLATGRLAWADAVAEGAVRASGERADLSAALPLLS